MAQPAFDLPFADIEDHGAEIRRATDNGEVVYLTDHGERLAAVIPLRPKRPAAPVSGRFATVAGTLPDFERFVDVEASRDSWSGQ